MSAMITTLNIRN